MSKKLIMKDKEFADDTIDFVDEMVDIAREANSGAAPEEVEDKVIASVADFIDRALPFDVIIPGPVGAMIEAKDDEVIEDGLDKLVDALKKLFRVDPEKKAARKKKRAKKKRARQKRRAERRAARQD